MKSGCTYWHAAAYLDRADLVVLYPHSAPSVTPEKVPDAQAAAHAPRATLRSGWGAAGWRGEQREAAQLETAQQ